MAQVGIDAIHSLVGFLRRFGVLTAIVHLKPSAQSTVGVATHAPDQVLSSDL
jgi:hypothetical protein